MTDGKHEIPEDLETWYSVACDGIEFATSHKAVKQLVERIAQLAAPVSDEEWGKGRHLANRSHVNDIIANRSKQEKP